MASGFLYLEDGRCFARRMSWIGYLLGLINNEIKLIEGAELFSKYLEYFIPNENDESNGYGGFIKKDTNEHIMLVLDLREFTKTNQKYFWIGAQNAVKRLITSDGEQQKDNIELLKILLDMHKSITRGENPALLSDTGVNIRPYSGEKKGPGWE